MNKIFNIVIIGCLIFSLEGVASAGAPIYVPKDTRASDFENSIMNMNQILLQTHQQKTNEKMVTFRLLKELREEKKAEQIAPLTALATIIKQVMQREGIETDDWNKYTEQEKALWGEKANEYNKLQNEINEIEDKMRELAGLKKKEKK